MTETDNILETMQESLNALKLTLKQEKDFDEVGTFIRTIGTQSFYNYDTHRMNSKAGKLNQWKVLVAKDDKQFVVRDNTGYHVHRYTDFYGVQTVTSAKDLENLLICKDKKSRELAKITLTEAAKQKYGSKK